MISVPGIGSGLDVDGIVRQLVAVETQPKSARLDRQEGKLQSQLSAIGALKGALDQLRAAMASASDGKAMLANTVSASADDLLTATLDGDGRAASYSVEVLHKATAQSLASEAFAELTDIVGQGTLTINRGTVDPNSGVFSADPSRPPLSITIDASNNTLAGIRDALNDADIGLHANIIDDGSGNRLVLSSDLSGVDNVMQISVADADGNDTDNAGLSVLAFDPAAVAGSGRNLVETRAAQDAILRVDGLQITRSENSVAGVLDGITLDLRKAAPGEPVTVTVAPDLSRSRSVVEGFVSSYNDLMGLVKELSSVNRETGAKGPMVGDATLRSLTGRLRGAMTAQLGATVGQSLSLAELGISTTRDGTLELDGSALDKVLENDRAGVARIFANLNTTTESLVRAGEFPTGVKAGEYAIEITQMPAVATLLGGVAGSFAIDAGNDQLQLAIDGVQSGEILLIQQSYADGAALAAEMQARINADPALAAAGAAVSVGFDTDSGAFLIESERFGSGSAVEIVSVDSASAATLGLAPGLGTAGVDVAGFIGGIAATGSGRELSGTGRLDGLSVTLLGGNTGVRGSITISRGIGGTIDGIIDSMLDRQGALQARTDGIDERLGRIGQERERLDVRAQALQERLFAQYRALDQLMSQMSATSAFLTQQLAGLGASRKD
jgi:flagellar hook-associated protein 2